MMEDWVLSLTYQNYKEVELIGGVNTEWENPSSIFRVMFSSSSASCRIGCTMRNCNFNLRLTNIGILAVENALS